MKFDTKYFKYVKIHFFKFFFNLSLTRIARDFISIVQIVFELRIFLKIRTDRRKKISTLDPCSYYFKTSLSLSKEHPYKAYLESCETPCILLITYNEGRNYCFRFIFSLLTLKEFRNMLKCCSFL